MQILIKARCVADYVANNWQISHAQTKETVPVSENLGAIMVDAVFQAGLNYRTVVFPRVEAVARAFPGLRSLEEVDGVMRTPAFLAALNWGHPEKPRRLWALVAFLRSRGLETIEDMRRWLAVASHRASVLALRGVGPKTVDYLAKLVGLSVVAVDRHALRLLRVAGISECEYGEARRILEFAADLLGVKRGIFDQLMWEMLSVAD